MQQKMNQTASPNLDLGSFESTIGENLLDDAKISTRDVNVSYGDKQAIYDASLDIGRNQVVALIGPSGCGKSTFLRCLNRMNDTIPSCKVSGKLILDGEDIYAKKMDPVLLRARVGMVFQKPNPSKKAVCNRKSKLAIAD